MGLGDCGADFLDCVSGCSLWGFLGPVSYTHLIDENTIKKVNFVGGCAGNTQGVARLLEGMDVDEAISRIQGIDCGGKGTSCPDQLAKALIAYKKERQ